MGAVKTITSNHVSLEMEKKSQVSSRHLMFSYRNNGNGHQGTTRMVLRNNKTERKELGDVKTTADVHQQQKMLIVDQENQC